MPLPVGFSKLWRERNLLETRSLIALKTVPLRLYLEVSAQSIKSLNTSAIQKQLFGPSNLTDHGLLAFRPSSRITQLTLFDLNRDSL